MSSTASVNKKSMLMVKEGGMLHSNKHGPVVVGKNTKWLLFIYLFTKNVHILISTSDVFYVQLWEKYVLMKFTNHWGLFYLHLTQHPKIFRLRRNKSETNWASSVFRSPFRKVCCCLAEQMSRLMPSMTWLLESTSFSLGFFPRKMVGTDERKTNRENETKIKLSVSLKHLDWFFLFYVWNRKVLLNKYKWLY